jgi:hypothetical protein
VLRFSLDIERGVRLGVCGGCMARETLGGKRSRRSIDGLEDGVPTYF